MGVVSRLEGRGEGRGERQGGHLGGSLEREHVAMQALPHLAAAMPQQPQYQQRVFCFEELGSGGQISSGYIKRAGVEGPLTALNTATVKFFPKRVRLELRLQQWSK